MKESFIVILAVATLFVSACSSASSPGIREVSGEEVTVSVAKPQRRELVDRLSLVGVVTPYEQVTLYAKVSGYLKSISVDIGDWVRAGQLLAEIDVPEMLTGLEEKRAALVKGEADTLKAEADVEQAQADVEFQKLNYQRLKAIHDRDPDVLPENDVDQARAACGVASGRLQAAKAQVKVAGAVIESARAEIKTFDTLMAYARIKAPISGVVSQRFVDPGALIQAASSSRTQAAPVVSIARLDKVRVVADVPEPKVRNVQPGTKATMLTEAYPGESFSAKVARTGMVLDLASRTMRAEFDIDNRDNRLRAGMTARISLELQKFESSLTVPVAALRTQGNDRSVFVVIDGKAQQRRVKTGLESPGWIQIVEGLSDEEDVVVAAASNLTDAAPVKVKR
ncbi:MAG: efflux RND transporter periplasmic adaptor subunit [Terriglobia bacterium]